MLISVAYLNIRYTLPTEGNMLQRVAEIGPAKEGHSRGKC